MGKVLHCGSEFSETQAVQKIRDSGSLFSMFFLFCNVIDEDTTQI